MGTFMKFGPDDSFICDPFLELESLESIRPNLVRILIIFSRCRGGAAGTFIVVNYGLGL